MLRAPVFETLSELQRLAFPQCLRTRPAHVRCSHRVAGRRREDHIGHVGPRLALPQSRRQVGPASVAVRGRVPVCGPALCLGQQLDLARAPARQRGHTPSSSYAPAPLRAPRGRPGVPDRRPPIRHSPLRTVWARPRCLVDARGLSHLLLCAPPAPHPAAHQAGRLQRGTGPGPATQRRPPPQRLAPRGRSSWGRERGRPRRRQRGGRVSRQRAQAGGRRQRGGGFSGQRGRGSRA